VAFLNSRDNRNSRAQKIVEGIWENEFGRAMTTDYVTDEAYIWLASHMKRASSLQSLFHFIHGNGGKDLARFIDFYFITPEIYFQTWELQMKYIDQDLGLTDLTTLAFCSKHNVNYLASFDTGLDGFLARIS